MGAKPVWRAANSANEFCVSAQVATWLGVPELADSGGFADTEFAADLCFGAAGFFRGFSLVEIGHDLLGVVFREFVHVI